MAIKTVGEMNQVFKNVDSQSWINKAELKNLEPFGTEQAQGKTFGEFLLDSVGKVNDLQLEANKAMEMLATGKSENIHETMLAVERADIAFRTMNQIRMKVIEAYREVMKMQV